MIFVHSEFRDIFVFVFVALSKSRIKKNRLRNVKVIKSIEVSERIYSI